MYNTCYVIRHSRTHLNSDIELRACKACGDQILSKQEVAEAAKQFNLQRRVHCLRCPMSLPESDVLETWEAHTGSDVSIVCDVSESLPQVPPALYFGGSVKGQIERGLPVDEVSGWPTAMAQLRYELLAEEHKSVTSFMYKHNYRMCDAIRLGFTFEMAVAYPEDWHMMLVVCVFTAKDLMAIGARFTKLVLAGMSLEMFSHSKMDAASLNIIRFNRHAFLAANGSKLQWDRIIENAGENPYNYTWGADSVFECCSRK